MYLKTNAPRRTRVVRRHLFQHEPRLSSPATLTGDTVGVQDASISQAGVMSTGTQTINGLKTFDDGIATGDPGDNARGVQLINNSSTCPNPAAGSTTICTKAGLAYIHENGGSDVLLRTVTDAISKNATLVTVCATGCNFSGIQAALDGTTSSASSPVLIVVMPGQYDVSSGVTLDPGTDSYKSIIGWSQDSVKVTSSNVAVHTITCTALTSNDLVGVTIADMTIEHTNASSVIEFQTSTNDHRFDITLRGLHLKGSLFPIVMQGSIAGVTTVLPSVVNVFDSFIEGEGDLVTLSGSLQYFSRSNVMRRFPTPSVSNIQFSCFNPYDMKYTGASFDSRGDSCVGSYNMSSGSTATVPAGCAMLRTGDSGGTRFDLSGFYGECSAAPSYTSATVGTMLYIGSSVAGHANVNVSNSTFRYTATASGQTMYGLFMAGGGDQVILSNVRFIPGFGAGTETAFHSATPATTYSEVLLDRVVYDSNTMHASIQVRNIEPTISYATLNAMDSVALPTTGASFDANSELRVYTNGTTLSSSWRNGRISDVFESQSLFAPQFRVYWKAATGTSGSTTWKFCYCTVTPPATFPCTVSTFTTVQQTVAASGQIYVTPWTNLTAGLVAGQPIVWTLQRDSTNTTMSGDAQVSAVEIAYGVK
jgi:hypothetical protein